VVKLKNLTIRVEDEMYKDIEELTALEKSDKSTVARQILAKGLQELKKKRAMDLYRERKCTLWKAAQIAGVSLREIIEIAKAEKITVHLSIEDVDEAWSRAFEQ
jgi:predicted HTH domain antitoxin